MIFLKEINPSLNLLKIEFIIQIKNKYNDKVLAMVLKLV